MSRTTILILAMVVLALFLGYVAALTYFVFRAFWREGRPSGFKVQGGYTPWYRPSERFQGDPWGRYWKDKKSRRHPD